MSTTPDTPNFEITYTPDYGEMFAVQRVSRRVQYSWLQRSICWLPLAIIAGLIAPFILWGHDIARWFEPLVGSAWAKGVLDVALFIVLAAFVISIVPLTYRLSARWLTQKRAPTPLTFTVDGEQLRWEGADSGLWVSWSAIQRLFLTRVAVCFLSGVTTYYLPRRVFSDDQQLRDFVDGALARLPDEARRVSEADPSVRALRG